MKSFDILKHPKGETQAVKQGWCWPAFFFGWIWVLVSGMWGIALSVIAIFFAIGFMGATSGASANEVQALINIASLITMIIFGANGNQWRKNNLISKGFEFKQTVAAVSKDNAVTLFMTNPSYTNSNPVNDISPPTFSSSNLPTDAQIPDRIKAKPEINALDSIINKK